MDIYIYIRFLCEKHKILSKDIYLKELSGALYWQIFLSSGKKYDGNAFDKMAKRISNKFPFIVSMNSIILFFIILDNKLEM